MTLIDMRRPLSSHDANNIVQYRNVKKKEVREMENCVSNMADSLLQKNVLKTISSAQ